MRTTNETTAEESAARRARGELWVKAEARLRGVLNALQLAGVMQDTEDHFGHFSTALARSYVCASVARRGAARGGRRARMQLWPEAQLALDSRVLVCARRRALVR